MRERPYAAATAGTAAVLLAVALTGCGAAHGTDARGTPTATARPGDSSGRTLTVQGGSPAPTTPAEQMLRAAVSIDGAAYRTTLTTRLTTADGQTSELRAAGGYRTGTHPAADLRRTGNDRAAPPELRLIGDTLYLRRPNVMRPGGGGKPWTRATVTTSSASLRRTLYAVQRGDAYPLVRMAATSRDVRPAGAATIGGVPTTHLTGTFRPSGAIRAVRAADRPPLRDLTPFHTLRFDAWLDHDGHPRKLVISGKDGHLRYALTQTFSAYGTPVHVTAPPSGQVEDGDGPVLPHGPRR